jgi:hypothetical protein
MKLTGWKMTKLKLQIKISPFPDIKKEKLNTFWRRIKMVSCLNILENAYIMFYESNFSIFYFLRRIS